MISLGRYLRDPDDAAQYVRALSLLVQGMELHTSAYDQEDYGRLRAALAGVQEKLVPEMSTPEMLALVAGAVHAFERYNRRTAERLHSQFVELRSIIATFSGAVASMVSASDASLVRLREIQTQLSAAEQIDDLRALRGRLSECLSGMASEVESHRNKSASSMARLAEGAQRLEGSINPPQGRIDPVTGLAERAEAEKALLQVETGGRQAIAVIFVLKRLQMMNSRFGYEAGNGVLASTAAYLGSGVNPEEGLYRWSGAALLAIIGRSVSPFQIRQEIGRLVTDMPEHEVTLGARTVMAPIAIGWTVFPVTRPVDRLVRQLDAFVESQSAENFHVAR